MRRLLIAMTAVTTLLAGGCGIPDDSDVTVVGPGRSTGTSVGDDGAAPEQPAREDTTEYRQFVRNYLQAAAGDPETAAARVKAFMAPDAAASFPPGNDVKVIRLLAEPFYTPDEPEVRLEAQLVGTLNAAGTLTPPDSAAGKTPYTFTVGEIEGRDGLFIKHAPPVLLLTDTALETFYQPRTIYFWNRDYTGLVPDLRYMPRSVIAVQQPTTVLGWLANGPAAWLEDAVHRLPQGTTAPDNVPAISNGTLQITLSPQSTVKPGDSQALDRLRRQLQWSLRPLEPRILEIRIGLQDPVRYQDEEYQSSNAAAGLPDAPERFVVYNGAIRRLADSPNASNPVPVLKPAANRAIVSAALSSSGSHTFAAVVTGGGAAQRLRVGVAALNQEADLREVRGLGGGLGRPVWAVTHGDDTAGAVGLIIRGGQLHSFAADGSAARPVDWPGQPGPVTSVSVAPDGHRVALVSGGRLYRGVLATGGDGIAISAAEQLVPPGLTRVAAVAWGSETFLGVAGVQADRRYSIMDLSADGALSEVRLDDIGLEPVTDLAAYPANPVTDARQIGSDVESYVAGGTAWDVYAQPGTGKITVGLLAGSSAGAPPTATPTAPFFLD